MAEKNELLFSINSNHESIKNEAHYLDVAYIIDKIKAEDTEEVSIIDKIKKVTENEVGRHIFTEDLEDENLLTKIKQEISVQDEIKPTISEQDINIKQEEIHIKDEIPSTGVSSTSREKPNQNRTGKNRELSCNLCQYKTTKKYRMTDHMQIHSGEKPFACNLCNFKAIQKSVLIRHMMTHTGEKPFACNLCDYRTARNDDLMQHMIIHTGEKPFECNLCCYKASRKRYLKSHNRRVHTGEKS